MKLTLKKRIIVGLIVLASMVLVSHFVYGEVPDVSKWSCPNAVVYNLSSYGTEVVSCEPNGSGNIYVKVSGELIYVHEHRTDADKTVYYNLLKADDRWVEVVNNKDLIWNNRQTENGDVEVSINDDNGVVVAKRTIPLLKK